MTGLIHCEYELNLFDIGYFNQNSSSTGILVNKMKKAILTKLNLLKNKGQRLDARIINKNTGLEYQCDHEYIKSNTTITIKLKPTSVKRIKYYKKDVDINDVMLNKNEKNENKKQNKTQELETNSNRNTIKDTANSQETLSKQSCVQKSNNNDAFIIDNDESISSASNEERIKKGHNGIIEDDIQQKSFATIKDKDNSLSPSTSPDTVIDANDVEQIEKEQLKILGMLQDREKLEREMHEQEKAKMYYYYGPRYYYNHYRFRDRYWNRNRYYGSGNGYNYTYNNNNVNYNKQKRMNKREFGDYMMKKFDPNNPIPNCKFADYPSNEPNINDIKIAKASQSHIPALSVVPNRNKPKSNAFAKTLSSSSSSVCHRNDNNINNHSRCSCSRDNHCSLHSNACENAPNPAYGNSKRRKRRRSNFENKERRDRNNNVLSAMSNNHTNYNNNSYNICTNDNDDFTFDFSKLNNIPAPLIKKRKI